MCLKVAGFGNLGFVLWMRIFNGIGVWVGALRIATLSAGAVPVLLGSGLASAQGLFDRGAALLCLGFALLAQIGSNFANDYLDGVRGTDGADRMGPQRAVGSGLIAPSVMRWVALGTLLVAFVLGLFLIPYGGLWLLGVGVVCVLAAWLYTGGPYPLAYHGLGDVCVVFFFGLVAVGCTYYVQAGAVGLDVVVLGLGSGLLTNTILVVNNYRDVDADRAANKRTLLVRWGRGFGLALYYFSGSFAASVLVWFWLRGYGAEVLLGLIPIGWSFWLGLRLKVARDARAFGVVLRSSGQVVALYGVLTALGLAF